MIVPTYNSASVLHACLASITSQSYPNIELIVVDNNSKDATKSIAKKFTEKVYSKGPERSAQRNYGVSVSSGEYLLLIDSDMELGLQVVEQSVNAFTQDNSLVAIVIPEESFGESYWAKCRRLERSFYLNVEWMEAARAFRRSAYMSAKGYDESMVSGEDWDLAQRLANQGKSGRIQDYIRHNEGNLKLVDDLKKKFFYAQEIKHYTSAKSNIKNIKRQTNLMHRYILFLSDPKKLFINPALGIGVLILKGLEFTVGALGYLLSSRNKIMKKP